MQHGLLLINLGTPDSLAPKDIRRFLRTFLSDGRVIDLPALPRWLLTNGIIVPLRAKNTRHAYQSIWTPEGSPLRTISLMLRDKLANLAQNTFQVEIGMRYGTPALTEALDRLKHCESITLLPLYPQYASSSSGSAIEHALSHINTWNVLPNLRVIRDFYQHPAFIAAQASCIREALADSEHLLLSYHGVPVRHLEAIGCRPVCEKACRTTPPNGCYRAQCLESSRLLGEALGLAPDAYTSAFQSRVGKLPWIKPFTDATLNELRDKGIRRLAVSCPAFVTDCLETLEEIGMRAREEWLAHGGESLTLVPCLNTRDDWVEALYTIASGTCSDNV